MDIKEELKEYDLSNEIDYIDIVDEELAKNGSTNLNCPRCGGKLIRIEYGSSHVIKCENDNCINVSYRGL